MPQIQHDWNELHVRHLNAGVAWIRFRLECFAGTAPSTDRSTRRRIVRQRGFCGWLWGRETVLERTLAKVNDAPKQPSSEIEDRLLDELNEIVEQAEATGHPVPLKMLSQRIGLTPFEEQIVLLCAAAELDTSIGPLCASAAYDPHRPYPTFGLALKVLYDADWAALTPDCPLRRDYLLDVQQPSGTPLIQAALRIDEHVLHFLKGWVRLDDRLAAFCTRMIEPRELWLSPSQSDAVKRIHGVWKHALQNDQPDPVAQLAGPDRESKRLVAQQVARNCHCQMYELPLEQLSANSGEIDLLSRLWSRDSRLLGLLLYIDADDDVGIGHDGLGQARQVNLNRFLGGVDGGLFLATRDVTPRTVRNRIEIEVLKPTAAEQRALWAQRLGDGHEIDATRLASQFSLNGESISKIAEASPSHGQTQEERFTWLWEECRHQTRPRLDGLAQRIETHARWSDLELADPQIGQLRDLAGQIRFRWRVYDDWKLRMKLNRGLGVTALFAGESGTGKTMAAEVIANDLELDLFRVDISAVVSKYIGETEKNLRKVFDAFEDSGSVLFFDECDALFGKRTEVKDSHDRYANIEVSYLLQRLEAYSGLALLATNNKGAVDTAFLRRLRFVVTFASPNPAQRENIWRHHLPSVGDIPAPHLNYQWLAKFELTGGNIHTASVNAAFLAAQRGHDAVTMQDVRDAIRSELIKLNRPASRGDFDLPVELDARATLPHAGVQTTRTAPVAATVGKGGNP